MDDSYFDMENYSSLVDVKLLLKRILDSYWNKLVCKFCITVCRFHARVQSSTCVTYEECNNDRANSEISYTTDNYYSFWDRQKAEFCMLQLCAFFPPAINFCHSKFSLSFFYILLLVPWQTYIWQKKIWALLTDLLKVTNNIFLPDNYHTQNRTYSLNTHP